MFGTLTRTNIVFLVVGIVLGGIAGFQISPKTQTISAGLESLPVIVSPGLPDAARQAIAERIADNSFNFEVVNAEQAPNPENNRTPFAGSQEIWCVIISPPTRGAYPASHYLVARRGNLWQANRYPDADPYTRTAFLEIGCNA